MWRHADTPRSEASVDNVRTLSRHDRRAVGGVGEGVVCLIISSWKRLLGRYSIANDVPAFGICLWN